MPQLTITAIFYHCHGVSGEGFHVVLFDNEDGHQCVATVFEEEGHFAVLERGLLAHNARAFGRNSWRSNIFEAKLRAEMTRWRAATPKEATDG